jgi:hypothetical protein
MKNNLSGCSALIYDDAGSLLATTRIWEHNLKNDTLRISDIPEVEAGCVYDLLIPASPTPYTCKGKITKLSFNKYIHLFRVKQAENRLETRYSVDFTAEIEALIYDGVIYSLHKAIDVNVKNLSKSGIRIATQPNILLSDSRFCLRLKIGEDTDKTLMARVVNNLITDENTYEFGCRLISRIKN